MMRNQKGFTLIEIIAVLVILGILAAVAIPRYIDLATQAKISAAAGEVAEVKSTLNLGYYRYFLQNSAAPTTGAAVITAASLVVGANSFGTAPDLWSVTLAAAASQVTVAVVNRNADTGYAATGTWNLPQ
jgi:prepilin-type N-terminal cleavage/methylation domain-containing protein